MTEPEIREHVVEALLEADLAQPDEATLELLLEATAAERRVAADVHGALADLSSSRAAGLAYALTRLGPYWRMDRSLGAVLKVAPPEVAERVLEVMYRCGWAEADGLPPRPGDDR